MAVVTMKQLLESGVHFGHQTRRWNPKMKRFIMTERNGIYIIDLQQSLSYIDNAYDFVKETVAHGGSVLFVGTKKQAQDAIAEQSQRVGMPHVNQRWLGGMLTNFSTVHKRLQRLKELEVIEQTGGAHVRSKKEALMLSREKEKLARTLGGIRDMQKLPSAVWIVDTKKEHIAVAEGLIARAGAATEGDEKPETAPGSDEPLADWERELLQGGGAAAAGGGDAGASAPATPPTAPAAPSAGAEATPQGDAPAQS